MSKNKSKNSKVSKTPINLEHPRIIAIDPTYSGFGFAIFEGPQLLVDWGFTKFRFNRRAQALQRFQKLIEIYKPSFAVFECHGNRSIWRGAGSKKLLYAIKNCCLNLNVPHKAYSRDQIRQLFDEFQALSKDQIVKHIIEWLPELEPYAPPKRAVWDREDDRMNIFDAVSLALTYYAEFEEESNTSCAA